MLGLAKYVLGLSFKDNSEDKKLLDWINEHSNKSGFVKDILKKEMEKELRRKLGIFTME
ncbi:MAG: hypothetical protein K0R54_2282 [Clostridiaceae bacterium]|nr:hypothetical protein [Clostridiaceae bacterium]